MCCLLKRTNKVFKFIKDKHIVFFKRFTEKFFDVGHKFSTPPLSKKNQVLNSPMACYIENLLFLIKFGIKLITVGHRVTQHKRKFLKKPKILFRSGLQPCPSSPPQNSPLLISPPSDDLIRGARAIISLYSNFNL